MKKILATLAVLVLVGSVKADDYFDAIAARATADEWKSDEDAALATLVSSWSGVVDDKVASSAAFANKSVNMPQTARDLVQGYLADATSALLSANDAITSASSLNSDGAGQIFSGDADMSISSWVDAKDHFDLASSKYYAEESYEDGAYYYLTTASYNIALANAILANYAAGGGMGMGGGCGP
jgi:hypothetical protein